MARTGRAEVWKYEKRASSDSPSLVSIQLKRYNVSNGNFGRKRAGDIAQPCE
jgi:hypothetical protein